MAEPKRSDQLASAAEVGGLVLLVVAAFLLHLAAGFAVAGLALFSVGFFGLAR